MFYVAGIIARSVTSNVTMGLEDDGSSDLTCQEIKMEAAFFFQVNRGASPSPLSWFISHAYIPRISIEHWMRACC